MTHSCFTMWGTEISPTEEKGCGIQFSATEFWNEKLENYNFTKDGLMHFDCILLTGLLLFDSHILFALISDRREKKIVPATSLLKCFHNCSSI